MAHWWPVQMAKIDPHPQLVRLAILWGLWRAPFGSHFRRLTPAKRRALTSDTREIIVALLALVE
jgi:hypothetical protein